MLEQLGPALRIIPEFVRQFLGEVVAELARVGVEPNQVGRDR